MLKTQVIDSFPAGENPFLHDAIRIGTQVGKNVMVMHCNHTDSEECQHLIVVNTKTGERLLVQFEEPSNMFHCEVSHEDV